jgi:hypothetical protein
MREWTLRKLYRLQKLLGENFSRIAISAVADVRKRIQGPAGSAPCTIGTTPSIKLFDA